MTPHQEQIEENRALEKVRGPEWEARLHRDFVKWRASIYLADHVGDVFDGGMEYLEALLGISSDACRYCAGTGVFCGKPCNCDEGEDA